MKRTILAILTALALVLGGATTAEAHGRGATAFPLVPQSSASGLRLRGVVTCTTVTAYATHPKGQRALLLVQDVTVVTEAGGIVLDSIVDYETSMMAWDDVTPGHRYLVSVGGPEDGDSIRQVVVAPACAKLPVRRHR